LSNARTVGASVPVRQVIAASRTAQGCHAPSGSRHSAFAAVGVERFCTSNLRAERVPDDIRYRKPPRPERPDAPDEPRDLTALYDDEEVPARRRRDRPDEQQDDERQDKEKSKGTPEQEARHRRKRLVIAAIVAALLLIAAIAFAWYWFATLRWLESTDDAYTQADNTIIAPKVAGYVAELSVTDNQIVKTGDLLLRIDPRDYQAAADQALADVHSARAGIENVDAQIGLQQSTIDQARADITSAQSNLTFSRQENARYQALVQTGAGTLQRAQQAQSDLRDKAATLQRAQAALESAIKQLTVLQTQRGQAEATLQHNEAVLVQAQLNIGYTAIASPIDGAVGDRSVQLGQYVQPGSQLMTIVPMGAGIYVVANFKETQLHRMFRGEQAEITVDTFPGVTLHGHVDSLSPGSGAQFALLPPENATGNFTKIVQRVPVKILLDSSDNPVLRQMRPGLSVTATVDTRTAPPRTAETLVPAVRR
jgi:membrane fusion protein (multidrug efflux system)